MTAFYTALAFIVAAVILASVAAVLVACGYLQASLRKPGPPRKKKETTP